MNNLFATKWLQNLHKNTRNKGFTLLELLAVVVTIGVLASIALPSRLGQVAKGRQAEAKNVLGNINRSQQVHRMEFGTFGNIGSYTDATPGNGINEITQYVPPANNILPVALQLTFYTIQDGTTATTPALPGDTPATSTEAFVIARGGEQFTNDVLDYVAHVTQSTAGSFATIICEELQINNASVPNTSVDANGLVDSCVTANEVN